LLKKPKIPETVAKIALFECFQCSIREQIQQLLENPAFTSKTAGPGRICLSKTKIETEYCLRAILPLPVFFNELLMFRPVPLSVSLDLPFRNKW